MDPLKLPLHDSQTAGPQKICIEMPGFRASRAAKKPQIPPSGRLYIPGHTRASSEEAACCLPCALLGTTDSGSGLNYSYIKCRSSLDAQIPKDANLTHCRLKHSVLSGCSQLRRLAAKIGKVGPGQRKSTRARRLKGFEGRSFDFNDSGHLGPLYEGLQAESCDRCRGPPARRRRCFPPSLIPTLSQSHLPQPTSIA